MMKFICGSRIPLHEESFTDANFARFYDEHARCFMGPVYRRLAAKAVKVNPAGKRVLDVGTGSGRLSIELAKARPDWQITGIDISEEMLKIACKNAEKANVADRIEFRQSSAETLPFPEGYFDLVVSNASLHLWADPLKVFNEIARVTKPGGYCLIWDNLRLAIFTPLLELAGRVMGMAASQRGLWLQAICLSYTIGEVKAITKKSTLKEARMSFIPGILSLSIEWKKLQQ